MKNFFSLLLLLFLCDQVQAATPPLWLTDSAPAAPSLAGALNPDGTLRPGASGSFDARQFRMRTAPDGRPVFRPAGTAGAGDERWQDGFGLPGTGGEVRALVKVGPDVYVGGSFSVAGTSVANGIARWNGTSWSALGTGPANGVNGGVYALAVAPNGDLYAGGNFTVAGGVPANNIARWNGTSWSSLGTGPTNGVNGGVYALAVAPNGDLYAGGNFTVAGGVPANNIARWNGTNWSSLGTGLFTANGNPVYTNVYALLVAPNGSLYVGGNFDHVGGVAADNLARWDGSTWSSMGLDPTYYSVNSLVLAGNGDLYAGGGGLLNLVDGFVARWNGSSWSRLGGGFVSTGNRTRATISCLSVTASGNVYAGVKVAGSISSGRAGYLARWNGTSWAALSASDEPQGNILALVVTGNGDVYAGGDIGSGAAGATGVVYWSGTAWSGLGVGSSVNKTVRAVAITVNGDVYVGGDFLEAGGAVARHVARWNGTSWSTMGAGLGTSFTEYVSALAVAANGDLYAAGNFTVDHGAPATFVARWNGIAWSPLGAGFPSPAFFSAAVGIQAMVITPNGDVTVAGTFTAAGGVPSKNIAHWNGTSWGPLGTGIGANSFSSQVNALAVAANGDLYAGGAFTEAGGVPANNIARWNGTSWTALGTGLTSAVTGGVNALAVAANGDVYVGGAFTEAGGVPANNIARWNGTAWNSLGAGMSSNPNGYLGVWALALAANGDLYTGGYFTQAGGAPAANVARWNGTGWTSVGTGLNSTALALAVAANSKLYVGGYFTTTGDGGKAMAYFGIYDPSAPLAATSPATSAPAALFPNPAHGTATLRLPPGAPTQPLTLRDALGRVVRQYPAPAGRDVELDLRGLTAGVYLVRCGSFTQRLLVE